jgi:hypothetical protein
MTGPHLLRQVGEGDGGHRAQRDPLRASEREQDADAAGEGREQTQRGRRDDPDRHGRHPADPIGDDRPADHRSGQAQRRRGDAQRSGRRIDGEIARQQRQHGLRGVQLGERRDAGEEQPEDEPPVRARARGVTGEAHGRRIRRRAIGGRGAIGSMSSILTRPPADAPAGPPPDPGSARRRGTGRHPPEGEVTARSEG